MSIKIRKNPFENGSVITRYICPTPRPFNDEFVNYRYARDLAENITHADSVRVHCIVNGSFIFGDFIEAFLVKNNILATKMTLSTLSFSQNNIDSLKTLMEKGYIDRLNILVSDYFFSHEHRNLIKYAYSQLDNENNTFTLAKERNHCKVSIFATDDGRHYVIHGSSNLRSSDNYEQICFEENKELYDFYDRFFSEIIEKRNTINKMAKYSKDAFELKEEKKIIDTAGYDDNE